MAMSFNMQENVVFISGAFQGVGRYIADLLKENNYRVYGTSRKVQNCEDSQWYIPAVKGNGFLQLIAMDLCNEESIQQAIQYVMKKEQRIDILINNSGIVTAGSVEDTAYQEAYKQLETNFFGHHRVLRRVLPIMREQHHGYIINISSVNGFITLPFQSMYCASKYALEAMTEALRMEVRPWNIKVTLIEPGDMKTNNTANRIFATASSNSDYHDTFMRSMKIVGHNEQSGPVPIKVARAVLSILKKRWPPLRIVVGWQYKIVYYLKRLLPNAVIEFVIKKLYM